MIITITSTMVVDSIEEGKILRQLIEDVLTDCSKPHILPYVPTWSLTVAIEDDYVE